MGAARPAAIPHPAGRAEHETDRDRPWDLADTIFQLTGTAPRLFYSYGIHPQTTGRGCGDLHRTTRVRRHFRPKLCLKGKVLARRVCRLSSITSCGWEASLISLNRNTLYNQLSRVCRDGVIESCRFAVEVLPCDLDKTSPNR